MKAFTVAVVVGGVLMAGLVFAQQPPVAQPPAKPPVQSAPPQAPAAPAATAPAPAPAPAPRFPEGIRYAFVNIQQIAAESVEGKTASTKIEAFRAKKASDLNERNKQVEANQAKLRSTVITEETRAQVQRDIDKAQVEIQRMTQDAQAELQEMQNGLQLEFQRKLGPVIQGVAVEKGLHLLFSQADSGMVWADPGLDLTAEVIRRFDAAAGVAAPKK
jgi:outer membrane protein